MNNKTEESGGDLTWDELFGKIDYTLPSHCPQCGSNKVKGIVYGLPRDPDPDPMPLEERDYVFGGCCLALDSPGWHCGACGHRW